MNDARDDYRVNLPWEVVKKGTKLPMTKYNSVDYQEAGKQVLAAFKEKVDAEDFAEWISCEVRHCPC